MDSFRFRISFLVLVLLHSPFNAVSANHATPVKLFREYIGAEFKNVKFSDVPIDPRVDFHFILSFAIDYTDAVTPAPSDGNFQVYWDTDNLTPPQVYSIKAKHSNVKVAMSLAGDTVNDNRKVYFDPTSVTTWVANAIQSISGIINKYHLDGVDIDYEHFKADPDTFAECIGRLLFYLKQNQLVSFTSIAPYDSDEVMPYYLAHGSKMLVSFGTDGSGGLSPENGFFNACSILIQQGKLEGIFIWSSTRSRFWRPPYP